MVRSDGRKPEEMRKVYIRTGVLEEADGSAYVHWGGNKILCGVYGPKECIPKHSADSSKAIIKCRYMMSPFASKEEHGKSGPNRRSIEISKVLREALESVVLLEQYPRSQIDVFIDVLQAEGGTRVASLLAASAALADAGIPMRELINAVAVGKANDELLVDLSKEEDNSGQSDMPMGFTSRTGKIVLLQMDGKLTKEELSKNIDLALNASKKLNELQREALSRKYLGKYKQELDLSK